MQIALKVDVDTLRGTLDGVPRLLRLLEMRGLQASFLFSVGPDHTGRALKRIIRPGFLSKVLRTSVPSTYGWKTLAYGTVLPGPMIGQQAQEPMLNARSAGHEVGLHSWDHVRWQDAVAHKARRWTTQEWQRGLQGYTQIFGEPPRCFGAAGWQINSHVLQLQSDMDPALNWASDTRGTGPFYPRIGEVVSRCLQLPTTLPTMDELIGREGVNADTVPDRLLQCVMEKQQDMHVFTLHAELEGGPLLQAFSRTLDRWQALGAQLLTLGDLARKLDHSTLPVAPIVRARISGRSGKLALQG